MHCVGFLGILPPQDCDIVRSGNVNAIFHKYPFINENSHSAAVIAVEKTDDKTGWVNTADPAADVR